MLLAAQPWKCRLECDWPRRCCSVVPWPQASHGCRLFPGLVSWSRPAGVALFPDGLHMMARMTRC
jgi:hypothetical protein